MVLWLDSDNIAYLRELQAGGMIVHVWVIKRVDPRSPARTKLRVMHGIACCEPKTVVFQHVSLQRYGHMLY
jgi:hypothetical protein